MIELKIEQHGDVVQVVLPPELLALLGAVPGDTLVFEARSDGNVAVRRKSEMGEQVTFGLEILDEYRSTFETLAMGLER